ncbi:amino acid permease [Brevibacillus antibioticus]|uniref:Amino acid permease n=1 Tax=Brevibacillus antibioticus TaxID=2570228 RepID=A0A4U2YDC7_9BACL|nr:amino acid permease [Brevibacillus antibioticus]TKI58405.1 amino acid permease [Brevibacillus antibioticus]
MDTGNERDTQLQRSMKSRHLFMLSLGGVIGTGLFLNAGFTINQAGPGGALVAYIVGGILLYLVMTCLGELSVKMPVTGSFQAYASKYIGPASGFTLGWMYWLGSATTAGVEFTAAGMVMQRWFPDTPIWIWCALFIVLLFTFNALTTKGFAETEYWFAGIKVLAVLIFIIIGLGAIFGIVSMEGRPAPFLSNFSADGGLFPFGIAIVFVTMMNVVFSYQGSELIGIAVGEAENPQKTIPRAIRNVVFRILVFYVASVTILSALFPSSELGLLESPFVTVFDAVGIPFAADTVYVLLMSVSGIAVTFTWMGIALSQFNFRRQYLREGGKIEDLQFVAPFYPVMPLLCLALCTFILIFPAFDPTQRIGLFYGIGSLVLFYTFYYVRYGRKKAHKPNFPTQG